MRATATASPSVMATLLAATATCLGSDALRRRDAAATKASSSVTTRWPASIPSKGDLSLASVATYSFARREDLKLRSTALALELEVVQPLVEATTRRVGALDRGCRLAVEPGDDGRGGAGRGRRGGRGRGSASVQVLLGGFTK